jgi:hypothetical protein
VVLEVARFLREHPDCSVEEAAAAAKAIAERTQMCFIPKNLDYLRAGGRVSNVVALTGNLLQLHPCIEILDGQLVAKKKYRGALDKLTPKLIRDFVEKHDLDREHLYFIWSPGLEAMEMDKVLNTSDLLPTMLNLLGIDSPYDYIGHDAFAESYAGFVPFSNGSWISGDTAFDASRKKLISISGNQHTVTADFQKEMAETVQEFIQINNLILDADFYQE